MGLIELIIVVLLLLWVFGYFGRGRWYATGPAVSTSPAWYSGSLIHTLVVLAVILIILRLLGLL